MALEGVDGMLSTGRTGLALVCYLTAKVRPEHTIASMAEGKLRTPISGMEFAQELFSKGGWDGETILLEKDTVMDSEVDRGLHTNMTVLAREQHRLAMSGGQSVRDLRKLQL